MSDENQTQSIAAELAAAFSEESNQEAPKGQAPAAPATPAPAAAAGQASPEVDDPNDPLYGKTIEEILAHPKLGPAFQSWSDKAARKQIDSELATVRATAQTQTRQQVDEENFDRYVKSLNKRELAEELAADEDGFVERYSRWKESQSSADQGDLDVKAQVYALTTIVQSTLDAIAGADLTAEATAELETYRKGLIEAHDPQAATKWQTAAIKAIAKREGEKQIEGDADERATALAHQQLADRNASRPGGLASPGRRAAPVPDLMGTKTRSLIEDAFSS